MLDKLFVFSVEKMFSSIACIASVSDMARLPQVRRQTAAYIRKWPCLGQQRGGQPTYIYVRLGDICSVI